MDYSLRAWLTPPARFRWRPAIRLALGVLLLWLVVAPWVSAQSPAGPAEAGQELSSATELDYPPFSVIRQDGSADGFSVELLRAVTRVVGLDIHFAVGPWTEIKQQLIDGQLDVLPLVSYSRERDLQLDFSAPYLRMEGGIFVRKGNTSIRSEKDLKDKEVLTMRDDTAHEYARLRGLSDKLILTDSFEEAMQRLAAGKHDAVIVQQLVGFQLIKKLKLANLVSVSSLAQPDLKPVGRPLTGFEQKFCFAVPEGSKELLARLNEGLAIVISTGEYNALYQKWFGPILPPRPVSAATVARYLLLVLVPISLVALISGVWLLRRKVREKTAYLQEEIRDRLRAEQALVESVTFTRTILDNLPIGVAVNSVESKVEFSYMNDTFPRLYRTTREALTRSDAFWEEVYEDPQFRAKIKQRALTDCASNDPERMVWEEVPITRTGQETRYISARNIPLPGKKMMISTVWDVTDQKAAEEKLARLNADLVTKNTELEQLIFIISHDLRSPLVSIDGKIRELGYGLEDIRQALSDHQAAADKNPAALTQLNRDMPEALQQIQDSTAKMDKLLTGLLRLSRLGRAPLHLATLDMSALVAEVVESLEFQIRRSGAELEIGDLPSCRSDRSLVSQAFFNLLDNALKYLDRNRPGLIRITGRLDGQRAVYCLEDNGVGISESALVKIFDTFHRLSPGEGEGEGLGLAIVKRIVDRLEGEIWVNSTPGSGCRFYLALAST